MSRNKACSKQGFPLKQETNESRMAWKKRIRYGHVLVSSVKAPQFNQMRKSYIGHLMAAKTRCMRTV